MTQIRNASAECGMGVPGHSNCLVQRFSLILTRSAVWMMLRPGTGAPRCHTLRLGTSRGPPHRSNSWTFLKTHVGAFASWRLEVRKVRFHLSLLGVLCV